MSPTAGWSPRRAAQQPEKPVPLRRARLDQVLVAQDAQDLARDRRPDRRVGEREPVDEPGPRRGHRCVHRPGCRHEPERPIAGCGALGRHEQVGPDAPVIEPEPATGAPESRSSPRRRSAGRRDGRSLGDGRPVVVRRRRPHRASPRRSARRRTRRHGPGPAPRTSAPARHERIRVAEGVRPGLARPVRIRRRRRAAPGRARARTAGAAAAGRTGRARQACCRDSSRAARPGPPVRARRGRGDRRGRA